MQKKVREFNENRNCHLEPMGVASRLLDIESELGELSKEYLKCSHYGTGEFVKNDDFDLRRSGAQSKSSQKSGKKTHFQHFHFFQTFLYFVRVRCVL